MLFRSEEAIKAIDNQDYATAIDILTNQVSSGFQARRDVKNYLASAYAGKCGLNFANLVNYISGTSTTNFFAIFMGAFAGGTLDIASCDSAQLIMESIGTASNRTSDENIFMSLVGIIKTGTNLAVKMDTAAPFGTIDGVPNDFCTNSATAGHLSDAEVKKIIVGLGVVLDNFSALTGVLNGGLTGVNSIAPTMTQCANAAKIIDPTVTTCQFTKESDITSAAVVKVYRSLLKTTTIGFGTAGDNCDMSTGTGCCP